MGALTIALVVLATGFVLMMHQSLVVREARWHLYAIRDELRWLAIRDADFRSSEVFSLLDRQVTALASLMPAISLWTILPLMLFVRRRSAEALWLDEQLKRPEYARVSELHLASIMTVLGLLLRRHLVLAFLLRLGLRAIGLAQPVRRALVSAVEALVGARERSNSIRGLTQ